MNKTIFTRLVAVLFVVAGLVWSEALGAERPARPRDPSGSLYKPTGTPRYSILNINNFTSWMRADGISNHSPFADNGGYFPRGTRWAIYQDGFMFGGKAYRDANHTDPEPVQTIRVGGATYNVGTVEGRVIGFGATAEPQPSSDPSARIYRIRRDYANLRTAFQLGVGFQDLQRDAAEVNEIPFTDATSAQMQEVLDQYEKDWNEWPVSAGAPFIDRNGDGVYTAPPPFGPNFTVDSLIEGNGGLGYDEPGVAGADPNSPADQVVWTVYNDLNRAVALSLYGSEPLGLEIQVTMWGYKRADALGNLYFKRAKFINKGGVDVTGQGRGNFYIDSMYFAQWSDPDLGASGDDLCGVDTTLEASGKTRSLAYVYNGNAIDSEFRKFNLPPPAVGYDFLAGPVVEAVGDSAIFDLKRRYDVRNLPMSSFAWFAAGSDISDPPFTREGGLRWWKMLRGFVPYASTTPDVYYPKPPGYADSFFPLSGDVVRGDLFIDGRGTPWSFPPGDRRIVLTTGPFRLAPGDTQEVYVGTVAGIGSDRLSSITVMKFNDRFVQNTFDALFQVPKPPTPPDVKFAELDGEIVLEWGSNLARLQDTEGRVNYPGEYRFEGYNVYQLPTRSANIDEGRRIATYDLLTDPTIVLDERVDLATGQVLFVPVQFGSNSDILRFYQFKRDFILDIDKLNNGQEYYLAVTAYSVANVPNFLPAALESEPVRLVVQPKVPFGTVYGSTHGSTIPVTHVSGVSDGSVEPIVVNPATSTGDTYEVHFTDVGGGNTEWSLLNTTKNTTVLADEENQSGDNNYKITEGGVFLKVMGPPPGMKDWDIPNGSRRFTWADGYTNFEGFESTIGWDDPAHFFGITPERAVAAHELKNVLLKLAPAASGTTGNPNAGGNPYGGWDENNPGSNENFSYGYRYLRAATAAPARPEFAPYIVNATAGYAYQDYKRGVPLSAWNMEVDPPQRLAVGHLENNVATGLVDGKWWPGANGTGTAGNSGSTREWLFIFDRPYTDATPATELQMDILNNGLPVMWWLGVQRRGGNDFSDGDEFLILANHVNTPNDVFRYTLPKPVTGVGQERASVDRVGVFPNPYYAFNPAETNRLVRFVTFNNLPPVATVRIFNLAGQLVRTIRKNDPSQFLRWDLNNQDNFPVASGMYIAHVEMTLPSDGSTATKILKIGVIQEQEVVDIF